MLNVPGDMERRSSSVKSVAYFRMYSRSDNFCSAVLWDFSKEDRRKRRGVRGVCSWSRRSRRLWAVQLDPDLLRVPMRALFATKCGRKFRVHLHPLLPCASFGHRRLNLNERVGLVLSSMTTASYHHGGHYTPGELANKGL